MIQVRKPSEESRESPSPNSVILSRLPAAMDIKAPSYLTASSTNKVEEPSHYHPCYKGI